MTHGLVRRVLTPGLLAVALIACGGADAVAPAGLNGRYELMTVDSKPVPALNYTEGQYTFEVMSGFYDLRSDNTFSTATTYKEKYLGWTHVSTHSFEGTFGVKADTLVFAWTGGDSTWTGIRNENQLTVVDHGRVSVFKK